MAVAPPADKKKKKISTKSKTYQQNINNSRNWPANFQEKLGCHACDGQADGRKEENRAVFWLIRNRKISKI